MEMPYPAEARHSTGIYAKHPIAFVRGQGARLWDQAGREYIDCMAGHGVANLGHAHPAVVRAIAEQAGRLITGHEAFYNDRRAEAMERLAHLCPGLERVYLCNSGTEAVEAAIKFARLSTGRPGVVAAMRGFHGRTLGALSATWNRHYRDPFEPLVPAFQHVPFNSVDALERAVDPQTAAVLLEVVQGEGGVHVADAVFLEAAQNLCRERGALLVIDEVQTGLGRTGKMLAVEHFGLAPDLLCLAKSVAGGVPMGAVLIGGRVQGFAPGVHGSTFGGNPLACAAAVAALDAIVAEGLPRQAAEKGLFLLSRLRQMESPLVREVRGLGLMIGIELRRKVAPYLEALLQAGVVALPAGLTVIRLLPPLVITYPEIELVLGAVGSVLKESLPVAEA
ncbi:MAG TPA: acetylornithine/succinylornithine family transaminase [Anaerolineales bacterium]|nr:acetylornithine/succinylornithine family transaminase [Anaerolineales bacterium]